MKRRALLFWLLAVTFTAASIAWLFYVPRQPGLLYRAIPASATFLSAHREVSGRWDGLAAHPLFLSLVETMGAEPGEVAKISRDEGFRRLLDILGTEDLFLSYVPRMRSTGEPAWVFASWLGGRSQRVRWMLKSMQSPELKRAAPRNGWLVWVWTPRELKGQRVTFSLVEGMVVGCVAPQTMGIDDLLAGVDGHALSLADRPHLYIPEDLPDADRGWYRDAQGELFPFTLSLTPEGGLRAGLETPWALPASVSTGEVTGLRSFTSLVGDRAVAAASVDRTLVRRWLTSSFTNEIARELSGLLAGPGEGAVALALLGGDYSGRFMAVRLPTLLASAVGSPVAQNQFVSAALDRLNAATRWGLVAAPQPAGAAPVFAIEATGGGFYANLAREEHLAFTPTDDGLLFASNLATLERLLRERSAATNRPPADQAWAPAPPAASRGFLWFNAVEGAKVVRLGVTAWSLKLLLEDPQGSQATRQRMNDFKAWMDTLAPLGQVRIGLEERDQRAVFTLQAGAP